VQERYPRLYRSVTSEYEKQAIVDAAFDTQFGGTVYEIDWQASYEVVRDAIIQHLHPRDGDEAEEAIMIEAVEQAANAIKHVLDLDADGVIALPPDSLLQLERALPEGANA
jgi:hypothetical protein